MKYLLLLLFLAATYQTEIILEEPVINQTYTGAVKITNLDYETGDDAEIVSIHAKVTSQNYEYKNSVNKSIKKFSSSKTSKIIFYDENPVEVCFTINETVCKTFFTTEEACSLGISDQELFSESAKIKFYTNNTDYEIEYWVESLDGKIVKDKRTTTNINQKSFTPSFAGAYLVKANINCGSTIEKLIAITKTLSDELEVELKKDILKINYESSENRKKGIKILINSKSVFETDTILGIGGIDYKIPELCGQNSFEVYVNDETYSFSQTFEECISQTIHESDMSVVASQEYIVVSVFFPEFTDYEAYIKGGDYVTGSALGLTKIRLIPQKEGNLEVIVKTEEFTLSDRVLFEKPKIIVEKEFIEKNVSAPLITGNVTESRTGTLPWFLFAFILVVFIADKFKKYRRALKTNEE